MNWNAEALALLASRAGAKRRWLLWVHAKDRATGAALPMGLWDGPDHRDFAVEGVTRTYFGAQGGMTLSPIGRGVGVKVRSWQVEIPVASPEAVALFQGRNVHGVMAELHVALWRAETNILTDIEPVVYGLIDAAPVPTPAAGSSAMIPATISSMLRAGARAAGALKSPAMQVLRSGDQGRKYSDLGPTANDVWGAS